MAGEDSILNSIKKVCNVDEADTSYDMDFLMHINTVFSILEELGIGPAGGYMIEDKDAVWDDFLSNDYRLNKVKTYMNHRVRLFFDPPPSGPAIAAMEKQVEELGWRIGVTREGDEWTSPLQPSLE